MPTPTIKILADIEKTHGETDKLFNHRISPIDQEVKQADKIRLDEVVLESLELPKKMRVALAEETVALVRRCISKAVSLTHKTRRKRVEAAEKTLGIWTELPDEEEGQDQ